MNTIFNLICILCGLGFVLAFLFTALHLLEPLNIYKKDLNKICIDQGYNKLTDFENISFLAHFYPSYLQTFNIECDKKKVFLICGEYNYKCDAMNRICKNQMTFSKCYG